MLFQKIDLSLSRSKLKNFEGFSRTVEDVTRSIHVTKSEGRLSDFTFTQGLVENLGLVTSTKI